MLAGELLDQLLDGGAGGAIAGVPADSIALAAEILDQAVDVGIENIRAFGASVTIRPGAGGGAAAELLDLLAEHRAAVEEHLEPVIVGRVVAAGDLDPALHIEDVGRVIEHRARADADPDDVEPALHQPVDECAFQLGRVQAAVPSDGDPASAFVGGEASEASPERPGVFFRESLSDDSADVIFAQDGSVECVGHRKGEHTNSRIGSTQTVTLNLFQGPFGRPRHPS